MAVPIVAAAAETVTVPAAVNVPVNVLLPVKVWVPARIANSLEVFGRAYLHAWETGSEAKAGIRKWIEFYHHKRPHSALGGKRPAVIYWQRNEATKPDQQVQRVA